MSTTWAEATAAPRTGGEGPLLVTDLLLTADALVDLLTRALDAQDWLDAYLAAAGLTQLVEDRSHPDPWQLRRAAGYLERLGGRRARWGASGAAAAAGVLGARPPTAGSRRLVAAGHVLASLTQDLADLVIQPDRRADPGRLVARAAFAARCTDLLGPDVARPPACFRSFDQHPDDVRRLVRTYLDRVPVAPPAVCVVGVRTSGSYLAPLHAAALRAEGIGRATVLTYRPARAFLGWERAVLRATARAGGTVLVCDDPPGSGTSLADTIAAITGAGVAEADVTMLLSVFGDAGTLPPTLRGRSAVLLPWPAWSVHERLEDDWVARELALMLGSRWRVESTRRLAVEGHAGRGHMRARFAVELTDRQTGGAERRDLLVEGAGLGYLGRHALAVAAALPRHVPRVYGFTDGLLFREWLPPLPRPIEDRAGAHLVASYVIERARALPVASDPTGLLRGRDPVWEVAAELLGRFYGPAAPAAQVLALEPLTRRLLKCARPSVVDGATDLRRWLPDPGAAGRMRKVDFHQYAFSNTELSCYDPVFDLAGAAAAPATPTFEARLRQAYQAGTGRPVDGERWLLYRLTHLHRQRRAGELSDDRATRASAAAVHDYLAGCYLQDLGTVGTGPVCALDLDGVLETDRLGYPTASPAGVLALRALRAHGFRPVLATGRSLGDAVDRCTRFGLAGAVAEYGTVTYDAGSGEVTDLRSEPERRLVGAVRLALEERGLDVDAGHRYAVRVRLEGRPLPDDLVRAILPPGHETLRVVQGEGQTDVTPRAHDKGTGLAELTARLGGAGCALAVGDSASDLPMLARAGIARAPRNADATVRAAGVRLTRHGYQLGLVDACADLLGHRPGTCAVCRPPAFPPRTRAMLTVLGLPEDGTRSLPARSLQLMTLLAGRTRW